VPAVPAEPISLAEARRARVTADERRGIGLVIQSQPGAVVMLIGGGKAGGEDNTREFWLSPELAEAIGNELARAAAAARGT
jgi:hypothetical protein